MAWNLDSSRPIYAQIAELVRLDIISGLYAPGTKLPSVRALAELERSGLVHSMRTSGRFITEDTDMIQRMKEDLAKSHIREFLEKMSSMGMTPADTLALIEKILKEER